MTADIAVVGAGVMGSALARNFHSRGLTVAVHNRAQEAHLLESFMAAHGGPGYIPCPGLAELVAALARPRKILIMVTAGAPVDEALDGLLPLLEPGDTVADGGNSFWRDTERRAERCRLAGVHYVGMGVSGGVAGARLGPSMMPGGDRDGWPAWQPLLEQAAGLTPEGAPCCAWIGPGGAGHFVKMVHNGIEYGDMALIAEVMDALLASGISRENAAGIFERWNDGPLQGYLTETAARILRFTDRDGGSPLDWIDDAAGQKGTGGWALGAAAELGVAVPIMAQAVFARGLSARDDLRRAARGAASSGAILGGYGSRNDLADTLGEALLCGRILNLSQGFDLLQAASAAYGWGLGLGTVANIWRGGCIIRSALLARASDALDAAPDAPLLASPLLRDDLRSGWDSLQRVAAVGLMSGRAVPALAAAAGCLGTLGADALPTRHIQAMRDYFGAHGVRRRADPEAGLLHIDWEKYTKE